LKKKFDIPSDKVIMSWLKNFEKDRSYTHQEVYDLMCTFDTPEEYEASRK